MSENSLSIFITSTEEVVLDQKNLRPFGDVQFLFAQSLSRELTSPLVARQFPELAALGFWLRPANLKNIIGKHNLNLDVNLFVPRGLVFHIAPSNVDTIFVYSWFISLLCGNRNLIRISEKINSQNNLLLDIIVKILSKPEFKEIAYSTQIISYGHDDDISKDLSLKSDVRVVWGGDNTIKHFRSFQMPPHATELCFSNKFSLCIIDSDRLNRLSQEQLLKVSKGFYNDSYWFGQMACSSPRLVLWRCCDENIEIARENFWRVFEEVLNKERNFFDAADFVNKEISVDSLAFKQKVKISSKDNRLTKIWLDKPEVYINDHCGLGLFHESKISHLNDLSSLLSRSIQTVSYFGLNREEVFLYVKEQVPVGIDRFCEIGHALDFGSIWDGLDLFRSFLRQIDFK